MNSVDVGDTVTFRHTTATVLRQNLRQKTILISYRDTLTGESVKLWVRLEDVETW